MAGPVRYLSGRQNSVKIGIPDYRTEDTSLVVLGRVGIGTTNATSDLYVKGGGEFTGVVTATKFDGAFENITLTGVTTTQQFNTTIIETETINITGISTFGDIVNLIGSTAGVTSVTFSPSTNTVNFLDQSKATFGDGGDLQIFHDGEKSVISDNGTGKLLIRGENSIEFTNLVGEEYLKLESDGAVTIYHDDVERITTTGYGATISGTTGTNQLQVTGVSTFVGSMDIEDSIDVDGQTQLDAVNVAGVSTFGAAVDINADVNLDDNTLNINYATGTPSGSIIRVATVEKDVDLIRLSGASNDITMDSGDYGFNVKYLGTRDGNNKTLSFITDNQTGTQVEALSILQDGKVGIGTSRATKALDVYGETRTTDLVVTKSATFAGVSVSDELGGSLTVTGIATFGDTVYVGENLYHKDDTDTYIKFEDDNVKIFAGNEQLIDVYEGAQDYVKLGDGGDVDINLNDALHVDGLTKNVGIGTTTIPSQQLDVDGNVRIQGALYDKNNQSGTSGQVLISTADGIDWVDGAPSNAIAGFTVKDEGTQQGTLGSITQIDFVGTGINASASGNIATVTSNLSLIHI